MVYFHNVKFQFHTYFTSKIFGIVWPFSLITNSQSSYKNIALFACKLDSISFSAITFIEPHRLMCHNELISTTDSRIIHNILKWVRHFFSAIFGICLWIIHIHLVRALMDCSPNSRFSMDAVVVVFRCSHYYVACSSNKQ